MKFTKQESSMIRLAVGHMGVQQAMQKQAMEKKAALQDKLASYGVTLAKRTENPVQQLPKSASATGLQDKLAEYGIGMSKKATGPDPKYQGPNPGAQASSFAVETTDKDPMFFGGTPYTDAMRAKYAEIMNNDAWKKFKWRQNRDEAARGAINEIKTNGWPAVGFGPYSPAQIQANGDPVYGNSLFKELANLVKNPEDQNDAIEKMNREGVVPGTRRSDHTGLSSTFRAHPRILAPQR